MRNNGLLKIAGFLLFILGGISVFLSFVGVQIYPLVALEKWGSGTSFAIKLTMMIGGIVLAALANTTPEDEADEKDMYIRRNENY